MRDISIWTVKAQCPCSTACIAWFTSAGHVTCCVVEEIGIHQVIAAKALCTIFCSSKSEAVSFTVTDTHAIGHVVAHWTRHLNTSESSRRKVDKTARILIPIYSGIRDLFWNQRRKGRYLCRGCSTWEGGRQRCGRQP